MGRLDDLEAICAGSELDVAEDDIRCVRAGPTDERDSVLGGSGRPYEANGDIAWLPAIDGGLECDGNGGMVVHEGEADRFEHAAIIAARGRAPMRDSTQRFAPRAGSRRFSVRRGGEARVVALGQCPGVLAARRADDPAGEVVGLDVDPAEEARLARLV